ncbi:MAG TPA: FAD-binding oxidoreductase [Candidatus Limnocylindria bacterium]|nr:FAD-binding oxidoreductase [Candidatus Limnocylindria bacterium]
MTDDYPYNGRISRWDEVAEGLAIVRVEPLEEGFPFEPGQYATLGLMGPQGKLIQRPMSISSPSTDISDYEFFIRLVHGGALTPLLWERQVGDPINIKGPKGKFLLQDDGRTCFFVATGTGLAPFISMIETLRARGQQRDIVLLHGVSYDYDLAWRQQLSELADSGGFPLRYAATVSRPQHCPSWTGLTGRAEAVLPGLLDELRLTADTTTLYLCGNPEMVAVVEEMATQQRGFPPEQIRKELYWPKGRQH